VKVRVLIVNPLGGKVQKDERGTSRHLVPRVFGHPYPLSTIVFHRTLIRAEDRRDMALRIIRLSLGRRIVPHSGGYGLFTSLVLYWSSTIHGMVLLVVHVGSTPAFVRAAMGQPFV
jgi:hypothetical protein